VVPGLSWEAAVVLGAVVAPTDPVAATAIFRRLGVPPRVTTLIEGEALLNDGTALVVWKIGIAVTVTAAGGYTLGDGARDLLLVSTGGIAIGLAGGWLVAKARDRIDDAVVEITITLLTPYVLFIAAEELGTSGILAAVSSGIYLGWQAPRLFTASTRIQAMAFWEVFTFLLESVLFIIIGLEFPGVVDALSDESALTLVWWAAAVSATVIAVRLLWVLSVGGVDEAYEARAGADRRRPRLSVRERLVVGWSGMRGAVSLAAALAIPLTTDAGAAFPARDLILFLTLCVIAVTLVLQGLTLPVLIRRLGVEDTRTSARRRAAARFRTVQAALERIADMAFDDVTPAGVVERARNMYTSRARQLAGECQIGVEVEEGDDRAWARLRHDLLEVERQELLSLREEGRVPHRVVLDVERDLDLEESRLQSRPFAAVGVDGARSEGAPARGGSAP
jgi:CPA1 family monovalent cation:H+ antiporter